jgi:transposase
MKKKLIIGIDVSKEKLDLCLQSDDRSVSEWTVNNSSPAIKASLEKTVREQKMEVSELLICAEYTGQYVYPLCCVCEELKIDLWLENPAQIKHSSGVQRGKNDRMDARRIAAYAMRFQDKIRLFSLPEKKLESLKQLVSERDMYICDKGKYQGQLTDQKRFMNEKDYVSKSVRMTVLIESPERRSVKLRLKSGN